MAVTAMTATRRRLVYGVNVAAAAVLAGVLAAVAVWAAGRFGGRVDVTRSGVNSLSPRTVQLLRGLNTQVTLTGLYSTFLEDARAYAEKHRNRVRDLLDLYETAGRGKVTTRMLDAKENPAAVSELLKRLAEKPAYKDEARPHQEVLEAFPAVRAAVVELVQAELNELTRLAGADAQAAQLNPVAIIARNCRVIAQEAQDAEADVQTLRNEEIPRYGRAVEVVRDFMEQSRRVLEDARTWMTDTGARTPGLAPETQQFFASAAQRYDEALKEVSSLLDRARDLQRVKLEDLVEELKRDQTVLVETPAEAEVLSHDDVWPWRTDRDAPEAPDGDPRDFAGEQAVSSAILRLTQKEKTAVIFTRFGGDPLLRPGLPPQMNPMMQMPQAPYQELNELLKEANFVTEEWDVKTQEQPPQVQDAARTIYVVFPPQPPQTSPMRPSPEAPISAEQKQRIFDAIDKSGMAIFLAGWQPPRMPFLPVPEKYEFGEYLKSKWGIAVKDEYLALEFALNPQREGLKYPARNNLLLTSDAFRYTDHMIGAPLRGLPAALQSVAPLEIVKGEGAPQDVTIEPIVVVDDTEDVWAVKDISRISEDLKKHQGTRRYEEDIAAPFPLAVAATNPQGHKLVVFASDSFVADSVLNMSQLLMVSGALRLVRLYPGNVDLFVNALHWLTGNADRIAVGPQRGDVPRLEKLKDDATLTFTQVFLVGIWPAIALLIGAGVWLVRRR